jgi:hypothetical protein
MTSTTQTLVGDAVTSVACAQVLGRKMAQRLYQRLNRGNPPKDWLDVAAPILAMGVLQGRAEVVQKASAIIEKQAEDIARLRRQLVAANTVREGGGNG